MQASLSFGSASAPNPATGFLPILTLPFKAGSWLSAPQKAYAETSCARLRSAAPLLSAETLFLVTFLLTRASGLSRASRST